MDSINPDPVNVPDDDLTLQNYQDDLDTSSAIHDPIMNEQNDDPTKILGVNAREFKKELDKYDFDDTTNGDDDRREDIEDRDLDQGDTTK